MAIGRSAIEAQILGLQPDNTEQLISPLDNRDSFQLVIDNFVNLEDNTFTNGLTLDGVSGDIKIGGALIENTTIEGAGSYSFALGSVLSPLSQASIYSNSFITFRSSVPFLFTSSQMSYFGGQFNIISYDNIDASGNETGFYISDSFGGGGIRVIDGQLSQGMRYHADYSPNYVARSLTDKAYQDGHLASVTASALAQSPTATEDGFALVYDHGTTSYTLASVGGGGSSTFDGLTDTPANKTGSSDFFVGVNSLETALEYISSASATARLDVFTDTLKGLVPLSGGGTDNFLRADGSWVVPDYSNVAITDNFIAIGNATNDAIEDSRLFMQDAGVNDTSLKWSASDYSDTSFFIRGGGGDANNTYLNLQVLNNPGNAFPFHLNTLYNKGVQYTQSRNTNTGTVTTDYHSFRMPNSSIHKFDLYNFGGVDLGTNSTWFTVYGGVDYMGHKYGTSVDPRNPGGAGASNYTWLSDNNQHVSIGFTGSGVLNTQNAHLRLYSRSDSPNPEPHLRFEGDYNVSNGVPSNNTLYLDSIDSKLHFKGSAGQNIIIENLGNQSATETIIEGSWNGNTDYQYSVSFAGAGVGDFFQVLPDEDVFAAINTAGTVWDGYAYCAVAGTVIVVCRVTTFINIPASSIFTVKKIN